MATTGQRLENPQTGEYFEFVQTAAQTNGSSSTMKVMVAKGGFKPAMHKHLYQDEKFEVLSGKLTYNLDSKVGIVGPGETVILPKGIPHTHFNAENEDLIMLQTASPAMDFEDFVHALNYHIGKGNIKAGQPPFLQLMVWMNEMKGTTCLASIPVGVQRTLAAILSPIGKIAGYKCYYN